MGSQKQTVIVQATSPIKTQTYEIGKSEFVFGRSGKADVMVDDAGISREHLKIKAEDGVVKILDLNSLNGVYIDNYRINPMEFVAVHEKSVISFGKCAVTLKITLHVEEEEAKTAVYQNAPDVKKSKDEYSNYEIVSYDDEKEKKIKTKSIDIPEASVHINFVDKSKVQAHPTANEVAPPPPAPLKVNAAPAASPSVVNPPPPPEAPVSAAPPPAAPKKIIDSKPVVEVRPVGLDKKPAAEASSPSETQILQSDETIIRPAKQKIAPAVKQNVDSPVSGPSQGYISSKTENEEKNVFMKSKESEQSVIEPAGYSSKEAEYVNHRPEEKPEFNKLIDLSAFPKSQEDYRLDFKKVGLDLPKYKNPGEHAKEIIKEAEYQKYAIIKSAEVFKSRTVNETRILAKKASDEAHIEFRKLVDALLENTRAELKKLRTDTEILLDEKRIQANEEIQRVWAEHEEQVRIDKSKQFEAFEKENKIKLDLSIEKARSDMFAERHKILTDAENEVLQKKRAYQVEFENEKGEHLVKIKTYSDEMNRIQDGIEDCKKIFKESKAAKEEAELELSKALSQLKAEKEKLAIINNSFKETQESHKVIEAELANFNETKQKALDEINKAQSELARLNSSLANLAEKRRQTEDELNNLNETLKDAKAKAKAEVENEYADLKNIEAKKFEDFKINELKELQKIRDNHSNSIKNFSVDLSQEVATKLELLASKSGYTKFDFEKHFELINSVIQVKSSINTGSESKHAEQLENWKNRKRKENLSLMTRGFVAGLICVLVGNFVYKKLNIDPVQAELARIAAENKAKDVENRFIPTKTDRYYDNYVDTTLYTQNFAEVYLDKSNQQEWVNYATKYFLRQWKVEEEKVIEVISNSNALVQNVVQQLPTMKKSKLKSDLAKLKELEEEYVQGQARILGTNVKYEAYKKIEKEFFQSKLQGRSPAGQD